MKKQILLGSNYAIIELSDNNEYQLFNHITGEIRQYKTDNVRNLYNHFKHINRLFESLETINTYIETNTTIHYNVASELTEKQFNKALNLKNLYLSNFDNFIDPDRFNTICYLVINNKI